MAMKEPGILVPGIVKARDVFFGDPGVGKTTLALTYPRPFVINTDFGLEGDAVEGRDDIIFAEPTGYRETEDVTRWMVAHQDRYDTIVLDAFDGLATILINEVTDQGKAKAAGNLLLEVVPEQAEYMTNQKQMERIINTLRRIPDKHIVLTGGVRQQEGRKRSLNAAPGLLAIVNRWASLMGELVVVRLNEAGEIDKKNGKPTRVLMLDPSSTNRECKTRWSALSPYVEEPTFDKLWAVRSAEPTSKESK